MKSIHLTIFSIFILAFIFIPEYKTFWGIAGILFVILDTKQESINERNKH